MTSGALLPFVLLALAVAGAVLVAAGVRQRRAGRRLRRDGVVVEAEVTGLEYLRPQTTATPTSGRFFPVVRFRTTTGRVVEARTLVGADPAPARTGDRVQVRYDPREPRRVELASGPTNSGTLGCLWIAVGVGLTGVAVVLGLVGLLISQILP